MIELQCAECLPEHMPLVTSHRAAAGRVRVPHAHELRLSCGAGRLLAYPLRAELSARCEAGRYRAAPDRRLLALLQLGCQEDVFEDVLHAAPHCAPPLQGRAYHLREAGAARHLAELCYDEDRGRAAFARVSSAPGNALPAAAHRHDGAPLSLLGNLNAMLDSRTTADVDRLLSDDARLGRRLRELLRHDDVALAGHALTGARLLAAAYFEDQNARVAQFASNKVAAWGSVAAGNLAHLQQDVAGALLAAAPRVLDVYAGTHGVAAVRVDDGRRDLVFAERFPVPKYFWTIVREPSSGRSMALVVLNDPLVAVSEIREAVFCESMCGRVRWARALRRHRRYEAPALGLAFCCSVRALAARVPEVPRALVPEPPLNGTDDDTLLTDI